MSQQTMLAELYPANPVDVPETITAPTSSFKKHAILAMMGLSVFIALYLGLMILFGWIAYANFAAMGSYDGPVGNIIAGAFAGLLSLFMLTSLFAVRRMGTPQGMEITAEQQPELFAFINRLADDVGAPKPKRVFLTPEVNAAVFYDLSLMNLIVPSKKNLIIGMGLVNVLSLSEFKAVLAHEFGHFSQNSMMIGRWVYTAQQIITYLVNARVWLDKVIRFVSSIDLRIAWLGWILGLIVWALRSLLDTLFDVVVIAERALSREMEFNADLVAVSVTGSDALPNALYKLEAADNAWRMAVDVADSHANDKKIVEDLFDAQTRIMAEMRRVLDDEAWGVPPLPEGDAAAHRVFTQGIATAPQMWSTHPPSVDRETNAKSIYIPGANDSRTAWAVFRDAESLRRSISRSVFRAEAIKEHTPCSAAEPVTQRFSAARLSPDFRGAYMNRSPVRDFASVKEMMDLSTVTNETLDATALYPETIRADLKRVRELEGEKASLEALLAGTMKPSGGVIRHRGEELSLGQIPDAIEDIAKERGVALTKLKKHEADCRKTHLLLAAKQENGWPEYLLGTLSLLHAVEHMNAIVGNEHARLVNTWQVITADGKIGYFEKRRMMKVCRELDTAMREMSSSLAQAKPSSAILKEMNLESWEKAVPIFDFVEVTKSNWDGWVMEADKLLGYYGGLMGHLSGLLLEDLLSGERSLREAAINGLTLPPAPPASAAPATSPVLMPGDEHVLQQKLDFFNRFQLAHGLGPTLMRTAVAILIVGGLVASGIAGLMTVV